MNRRPDHFPIAHLTSDSHVGGYEGVKSKSKKSTVLERKERLMELVNLEGRMTRERLGKCVMQGTSSLLLYNNI